MNIRRLLYNLVIAIFSVVFSTATAQNTMNTRDYIDSFKQAAMQEMRVHGVPASITLGQGVLESASGNSRLSRECNNHFGIKCRKNY